MDLEQCLFEAADLMAATKLNAATLQSWGNRGILGLSKGQQNPGPGKRRRYSALDAARIAAIQALVSFGVSASVAGQIARCIEEDPSIAGVWKNALVERPNHFCVFLSQDLKLLRLYAGNDTAEVARILKNLSAGRMGAMEENLLEADAGIAVFDVGPRIRGVMHGLGIGNSSQDTPRATLDQVEPKQAVNSWKDYS